MKYLGPATLIMTPYYDLLNKPCGGTFDDIVESIGHTPLVELKTLSPKEDVRIFAKLESANPTGSVKDRVARSMMQAAEVDEGFNEKYEVADVGNVAYYMLFDEENPSSVRSATSTVGGTVPVTVVSPSMT